MRGTSGRDCRGEGLRQDEVAAGDLGDVEVARVALDQRADRCPVDRLVGVVGEVDFVEDLSSLVLNRLDFHLMRCVFALAGTEINKVLM